MKIVSVEPIMLRLPDVQRVADGAQTLLLVKVHTDEGITGIGELHTCELAGKAVIESPFCSWSTMGLAEIIVGRNPLELGALWDDMYKYTSGYGRRGIVLHAISAIDMALWDILGKVAGLPIYQLLGGARQKQIRLYASDLHKEGSDILASASRYVENGFKAIKIGWGGLGKNLRDDERTISALRDAVGPDIDIMVDLGNGTRYRDALNFARLAGDYGVYFLEEPLASEDFPGFRRLVAASPVPIATGEKLGTTQDFIDLMDRGNVPIIQPDLARVGGFTELIKIAANAEARGADLIPHCWASDILVAASLHFLASQRDPQYMEFCVYDQPLRRDLITEPIVPDNGYASVPEKPGLGIEVNEEIVAKYRVN